MSRNQGIHSCGKTRFSFRTAIFLAVVGWAGRGSSLCRGHNCSCLHGPKGASGALDGTSAGMGAVIASLDGEISQFGCGAGGGGSGDSVLARASVLVAEGEVVTGTMLGELSWAASSMTAHDTGPKERRAAAKTTCGRRLSCAFRVRALIHDRISYETRSGQYYMGSFGFLNKSVSKVRQ